MSDFSKLKLRWLIYVTLIGIAVSFEPWRNFSAVFPAILLYGGPFLILLFSDWVKSADIERPGNKFLKFCIIALCIITLPVSIFHIAYYKLDWGFAIGYLALTAINYLLSLSALLTVLITKKRSSGKKM